MTERHAGIWGRVRALAYGEVSADTLEAYRRAGLAVFDLLKQTEERRLALKIAGTDPWKVDPATQAEFLCAWNAFALQALGDSFLDADYQADPASAGYVPPVTATQVHAFYAQVEDWLSRAQQAGSNPAYHLDVHVPADLPPWATVEPCPRAHLEAMLAATAMLRTHAEAALATFETDGATAEKQASIQRLHQLLAEARTQADYAQRLLGDNVPPGLHEEIERHAKGAIAGYYHLGQLLAMPDLVDVAPRPIVSADQPARLLPGPGQPGFDPWCLTDPQARAIFQRDARGRAAIEQIWRFDPDPARTLGIQAEIDAALARGDVAYAINRSGQRLGHFFCCPWGAVYVAKRPLTIGGHQLRSLEEFVFDVSAEGVLQGRPYKREIMVADFQPTTDLDYCDPRETGHDD